MTTSARTRCPTGATRANLSGCLWNLGLDSCWMCCLTGRSNVPVEILKAMSMSVCCRQNFKCGNESILRPFWCPRRGGNCNLKRFAVNRYNCSRRQLQKWSSDQKIYSASSFIGWLDKHGRRGSSLYRVWVLGAWSDELWYWRVQRCHWDTNAQQEDKLTTENNWLSNKNRKR